jgi:nucleoid-associated protein YgaU
MARFARFAVIVAVAIVLVNCPTTPKPPTETVAAPSFTPAEGEFAGAQSVTIASSTEGAEIRYTTDGTNPGPAAGTQYAGAITVSSTTTIKAIAVKAGMNDSPVVSATFTINGQAADVKFSPDGGSYEAAQSVTLASATAGAQIYYTTDGSDPDPSRATLYAGPVSVGSSQTLKAIAVKRAWGNSSITSAQYTISAPVTVTPVEPVTDAEVTEARNAIARAREVDADFWDPDNFREARRLFDDGFAMRTSDPATARTRLADSKKAADLSFDNSVDKAAQVMAANLEAARKRLLDVEADKFMPDEYTKATAGIDEAAQLYANKDYAGARSTAYDALKQMADLQKTLETKIGTVRGLKAETEQLMKDAESSNAYQYAPGQKDLVTSLYLKGLTAYQGYRLDDAEEAFGAAREAARDTIRIATAARSSDQEAEKKKADELQTQVMQSLVDASKLTVVTEDGTVIKPQNWSEDDFLKQIDELLKQEQQNAAPGGTSLAIPEDGSTVVLAEDDLVSLLQQARDLWVQGLKEKAAGNYVQAQDYFNEAQRYIDIYKSYAVKGVYTVRLIPDRRDCLWRIAEYPEIYGDPYMWPAIWRRNRKLIQNPDLIYPGWQLVIPPQ